MSVFVTFFSRNTSSTRKSLRYFTEVLDAKQKTAVHRLGAEK